MLLLRKPCQEVRLFLNTTKKNITDKMNLIIVHSACRARGQDPRIALQLERLVAANENAQVVQVDYRSIDMSK